MEFVDVPPIQQYDPINPPPPPTSPLAIILPFI